MKAPPGFQTFIVQMIHSAFNLNPCFNLSLRHCNLGTIGTVGYEVGGTLLTPHGGVWEADEEDPTAEDESVTPGWLARRCKLDPGLSKLNPGLKAPPGFQSLIVKKG